MSHNENLHNIGILLAVCSSLFIGSSFILKKVSLIRLNQRGGLRAGAGGHGYLSDWIWWLGILTMAAGELLNFTAYAFAPASLVTPLGALSVIVSAILASKFLNEKLRVLGKAGCILCILGSTVIVIYAPKEGQVTTFKELIEKLKEPVFINYVIIISVISILIVSVLGPRYGNKHVTVYITLCSSLGSLTVMACKGIGLALRTEHIFSMDSYLMLWLLIFVVLLVACICVQMNYLNKTLDLFSTSIVTPIYYVFFTTLVIVESAILFKEWQTMSASDIFGSACGFLIVIQAIFILNVVD